MELNAIVGALRAHLQTAQSEYDTARATHEAVEAELAWLSQVLAEKKRAFDAAQHAFGALTGSAPALPVAPVLITTVMTREQLEQAILAFEPPRLAYISLAELRRMKAAERGKREWSGSASAYHLRRYLCAFARHGLVAGYDALARACEQVEGADALYAILRRKTDKAVCEGLPYLRSTEALASEMARPEEARLAAARVEPSPAPALASPAAVEPPTAARGVLTLLSPGLAKPRALPLRRADIPLPAPVLDPVAQAEPTVGSCPAPRVGQAGLLTSIKTLPKARICLADIEAAYLAQQGVSRVALNDDSYAVFYNRLAVATAKLCKTGELTRVERGIYEAA
jgi:hypothetical protein